jgi:YesN/AraC family two-component response regulator
MNLPDYIAQVRMDKAAFMLLNNRDIIQTISRKVGILNDNYFYNLFKRQFGMTPAAYRLQKNKSKRKN